MFPSRDGPELQDEESLLVFAVAVPVHLELFVYSWAMEHLQAEEWRM